MNEFKTLKENLTENDFQIFLNVIDTLLDAYTYEVNKEVKMFEKFENLIQVYDYLCFMKWFLGNKKSFIEKHMDCDLFSKEEYRQVVEDINSLEHCILYIENESDALEEPVCVGKVEL